MLCILRPKLPPRMQISQIWCLFCFKKCCFEPEGCLKNRPAKDHILLLFQITALGTVIRRSFFSAPEGVIWARVWLSGRSTYLWGGFMPHWILRKKCWYALFCRAYGSHCTTQKKNWANTVLKEGYERGTKFSLMEMFATHKKGDTFLGLISEKVINDGITMV